MAAGSCASLVNICICMGKNQLEMLVTQCEILVIGGLTQLPFKHKMHENSQESKS